MKLSGHLSAAVFARYDIVSEGDLLDAARRLDENLMGTITGTNARPEQTVGEKG